MLLYKNYYDHMILYKFTDQNQNLIFNIYMIIINIQDNNQYNTIRSKYLH